MSDLSTRLLQEANIAPPPALQQLTSQVSQIASDLSRAAAQPSPPTAQLTQLATQLSEVASQLFQAAAQLSRPEDERTDFPTDEKSVRDLNEKADEIAQNLQREIARLLRSSATVQAEIRFYEGTIILEATITTIISGLTSILLASARKSFEDGLTHIIGAATRRVLQPVLRELAPQAEPIRNIEVTPQPVVSGSTPSVARSLPSFLQRIPTFDSSGLFLLFMTLTSLALLALIVIFIIMLASGRPQGIRLDVNTRRTGSLVAPARMLSPVAARSEHTAVSLPVLARFFHLPASRTN